MKEKVKPESIDQPSTISRSWPSTWGPIEVAKLFSMPTRRWGIGVAVCSRTLFWMRRAASVMSVASAMRAEATSVIAGGRSERSNSSTPSAASRPAIACDTAFTESDAKQPCDRQTRYSMTWAPGAMPHTGPRSTPYSTAEETQEPAAVVVVCVP